MRRIAVAIGGRANWGSLKSVVTHLLEWESVGSCEVTIIRYGAACSRWYGKIPELDGLRNVVDIPCLIDSETPQAMALHAGMIMIAVGQELERINPDIVLVCGDRYDVLPVAYAAALQNRLIAHTMGGETTGSIDQSVRWAITSLAHWHFVATTGAYRRVREREKEVWNLGCPRIDLAKQAAPNPEYKDAIVVLQHGVTTETVDELEWVDQITQVYAGKRRLVWLWGNSDYGSPQIAEAMRGRLEQWETHRSLYPLEFMRLLAGCGVLVGNSSSGVREGAYLGTPVVQVGTRQKDREFAPNVLPAEREVLEAVQSQLAHGRYPSSKLYGDGTAGTQIARVLVHHELTPVQK